MLQKVTRIISYYRVSTQKQGRSGLGLDAQKRAVADYVAFHGATIAGEFAEVESGTRKMKDRPQLVAAIAAAKAKLGGK